MKKVSLSGSPRENVGKKDAKLLRNEGSVPCVIYGGKEQIHFSLKENDFLKIVFTNEICFIDFKIKDKEYSTILQDVQYHPVSDKILHADFLELTGGVIKMNVPVTVIGTSPGVLLGGRLAVKTRYIPIKALPDKMPEIITLSIDNLQIGDKIKASELKNENYEILLNDNIAVIMILKARGAEVSEEDAEGEEGAEGAEGTEEKKEETK